MSILPNRIFHTLSVASGAGQPQPEVGCAVSVSGIEVAFWESEAIVQNGLILISRKNLSNLLPELAPLFSKSDP